MKVIPIVVVAALLLGGSALAHKQSKQFRAAYEARGDDFMEVLYWLPETRDTFRKHLPNPDQWVGFDRQYWKEIPAEARLKILDDLGARWDELDNDALGRGWERIRRWGQIDSQLELMITFTGSVEEFLDWAYGDELLQPTFDWVLERRPKDFDPRWIGSTLATGEHAHFRSLLIERLLDSAPRQEFSCYSRFYAHLAGGQKERESEPGRPTGKKAETPDPSGASRTPDGR